MLTVIVKFYLTLTAILLEENYNLGNNGELWHFVARWCYYGLCPSYKNVILNSSHKKGTEKFCCKVHKIHLSFLTAQNLSNLLKSAINTFLQHFINILSAKPESFLCETCYGWFFSTTVLLLYNFIKIEHRLKGRDEREKLAFCRYL